MTGCTGNDPAAHAESVESAAASTQECSETMHSYYGSKSNKLCNLVPLSTLIEGETWEWAQAPREGEEPEERVAKRVWSSRTHDLLETAVLPDDVSTAASNQTSMLWCGLNTVDTLAGRFTSNSMGRIDMQQSTEENTATEILSPGARILLAGSGQAGSAARRLRRDLEEKLNTQGPLGLTRASWNWWSHEAAPREHRVA